MSDTKVTIAVVGTGDMGSAVGGALVRAGYRVVTAGQGRSAASRALAAKAGIEDVGSLAAAVRSATLVLSIVPPAEARGFAAGLQELGIAKGDRVGLFLPNVPVYLCAYFGGLMAGATMVNFSPLYTAAELARVSDRPMKKLRVRPWQ